MSVRWLSTGAVAACSLALLYFAFPTRQYYWDGLSFSIDIEHAPDWRALFNVHHLLYDLIGYGEYSLAGRVVRALYLLQWTDCAAGGLLVWLAYRLFRSLGAPSSNSAACAVILGAAATFWKFTTDVDSYILANLFLVAAYLTTRRSLLAGALLYVCAMTMHQLAALFYPAALALIWRRSRERFWREAGIYTLICAVSVLTLYAAAYRWFNMYHRPEAPTLVGWLTFHAQVPFSFSLWSGAGWLLLGTGRLFAGGRLVPAAFIAGPAALALAALGAVELARKREALASVSSAWPLIVWANAYVCFLLVWEPYNTFYRLFYLTPLVALLAVATRAIRARPLGLIAAALLCWNFFAFIYPNTRVENNEPLAFALQQQKKWPAGTGIIFGRFVPDLWTISYFNPQVSWISLEQPDPARVAAYAAQFARDGGQVYLDWTYLQKIGEPAARFSFQPVGAGSARGP
jgi:hypothetical protein